MASGALTRAWHRHVSGKDDPRLATAFAAGIGFAVTLTCAAVMTQLRTQVSPTIDLGIFAAVTWLAGWWMTGLGTVITAVLAFLMLNGFVVDQYAVLRWHGGPDVVRLVVLLGCAGASAAARELLLRHRRRCDDVQLNRELAEIADTSSLSRGGSRYA